MIQIIDSSTWLSRFMRIHQQFNQKIHVWRCTIKVRRCKTWSRTYSITARPMEQCCQTEILRFNSKIHCEVTEMILIYIQYISTKCHENMCISFHLMTWHWILRKDKSFYDNLVGSWVKAALGSTVVSTWLGPPRFGLKAAKDAKLGLSIMATTPFFAVSIKGEIDQKMQKNTGKWSRRSLRIKSRR